MGRQSEIDANKFEREITRENEMDKYKTVLGLLTIGMRGNKLITWLRMRIEGMNQQMTFRFQAKKLHPKLCPWLNLKF